MQIKNRLFVALGLTAGLIASPALASSAASADITSPLRAAEAARTGTTIAAGDSEFRQLFANWRALDTFGASNSRAYNGLNSANIADTGSASIPMLVPVTSGRSMSSNFGMRVHPVLGGFRMHKGVDLPASTGTPIHATADGVIGRADWFGGYGLCVEIEHGANLETRYGHMSRIAVAEGQHVHKGDVIGYVGSTGRSTGPHLHYEVRIAGEAVNPVPYLQVAEAQSGITSGFALASNTPPAPQSPEE